VAETAVLGAGKDEMGEAELADRAQALQRPSATLNENRPGE